MELVELTECKHGKIQCLHHATLDTSNASLSPSNSFDYLFIGTQDGYILSYTVQRKVSLVGDLTFVCSFQQELSLKRAKPVEKIESDVQLNVLFVLCNGSLEMYELNTLRFLCKIHDKNVSTFVLDRHHQNHHRLCVCVKKRLMFVHYTNSDFVKFEEKIIPDTVGLNQLEWYGSALCLGLKREYVAITLDDNKTSMSASPQSNDDEVSVDEEEEITPLIQLQSKQSPYLLLLGEEVVLRLANIGIFVNILTKQPSLRNSVNWSDTPQQIAICFPYIVGVIKSKTLEIYNIYDQMLTKTETLPGSANVILSTSNNNKRGIFFSSINKIYILSPVAYEKQIQNLIQAQRFQEAFELFDKAFEGGQQEKEIQLQQLYEKSGVVSMKQGLQIRQAFEYFTTASKRLDSRMLLSQFFPNESFFSKVISSSGNPGASSGGTFKLPKQDLKSIFIKVLLDRSAATLTPLSPSRPSATTSTPNSSPQVTPEIERQAENLFEDAKRCLQDFLFVRRDYLINLASQTPQQSPSATTSSINIQAIEEELTDIDTSLVKLYIDSNAADAEEKLEDLLRREDNFCNISLCEKLLQSAAQKNDKYYYYLAMLYGAKKMFPEALELLEKYKHTNSLYTTRAAAETLVILQFIVEHILPDPKVNIRTLPLEELENVKLLESLIWKYSVWVMLRAPTDAIDLFKSPKLPAASVYRFLKTTPEFCSIEDKKQDFLLLMYLEHVVIEQHVTDQQIHTQLALKYIDNIMNEKEKLGLHLIKIKFAAEKKETIRDLRNKLYAHLEQSTHYIAEEVLARLKNTPLCEELVIVYQRLSQHEQALNVLLYDLKNDLGAENYCLQFDHKQEQKPKTVNTGQELPRNYLTYPLLSDTLIKLLKLCFNGPLPSPLSVVGSAASMTACRVDLGKQLLNKYAHVVDPLKTLLILPNDVSCEEIQRFLSKTITDSTSLVRDFSISKNLAKQVLEQQQYKLTQYGTRRVTINAKMTCPVCHRPIGRSVFVAYPDLKTIVHYSCIHKGLLPTSSPAGVVSPASTTVTSPTGSLSPTEKQPVPLVGNLQLHPLNNKNFRTEPFVLDEVKKEEDEELE